MYYKTKGYKIFSLGNHLFLGFLALLCIAPLIHILALSFSGSAAANAGQVTFWPVDFTLEAYKKSLNNPYFTNALWISVKRAIIGTAMSMAVMLMAAYALSKEPNVLRGRNVYIWYFIFTMLFSGGLIPTYMLITTIGLQNSFWVLILPGLVGPFSVILLLNFFRTVPKELEESALIDGAGHFRTFISIFLPISMPGLATISLFTIVGHWNSYFDGLIYMSERSNYPLASYLQTIIVQADFRTIGSSEDLKLFSQRTIKATQVFVGALPILMVYPFLQKYFVKGIVLGAVKE